MYGLDVSTIPTKRFVHHSLINCDFCCLIYIQYHTTHTGVVWPVDTMPQFLIYVSTIVSQAKAIDAVRHMLYRGWDPFNHWDVAIGFIVSASWTVVFLFIATILFNINK